MANPRYNKPKTPHYKVEDVSKQPDKEEIEPCVKYVVECWDQWNDHWGNRLNDFEKYYDAWIGKAPKRDEEWQAKFHKRLTWQAEKALVARLHAALFPNPAPIDVSKPQSSPNMVMAILAKSIVAHWFKIGMFAKEFLSGMKSAAIYGTGMFEDDWYVRTEEVYEKKVTMMPDFRPMVDESGQTVLDDQGRVRSQRIGDRPLESEAKTNKVVEDRYRVRKANVFAWRVHPNKIDDDDDYPAIKQEFITYDTLLEREAELEKYGVAGFENMDRIKDDKFKIKEEDARRYQKDGEFVDDNDPRLELLTYWGKYADRKGEGDKAKNQVSQPVFIMVVNRKYKIALKENPFWHKKAPLFHIVWTEDEKPSYYGIGLAQIGMDAEDRANRVVNIRTDVRGKNLRGGGWYNVNDKKIKKAELQKNVPGLWRGCSNVNEAYKPDIPIPTDPADYKEEEIAVNDHREITGAVTALLPASDTKDQHKTLGGLEILVGQGLQRLKPDLQMMETMGVRRMANRAFLMTRQFFSQAEAIELVASEDELRQFNLAKIYNLSPREIIGNVKFLCTGLSESIDKVQNVEKLLKFVEVSGKVPQMAQQINYALIAKRIATNIGIEDADEIINMYPQMPQAQAAPAQTGMQPAMPTPPAMPGVMPPAPMPLGQSPMGMQVPPMPRPMMPQGLPPQILMAIAQRIGATPQAMGVPPGVVPVNAGQ